MPIALPPHEHAVLTALSGAGGELPFDEIVSAASLDQSLVAAAARALAERGWIEVEERAVVEPVLTDEGREAADKGTPERQLLLVLDLDQSIPMPDVHAVAKKKGFDGSAAVQWIFRKNWAEKGKPRGGKGPDVLRMTHDGEEALLGPSPDEVAIGRTARGEIRYLDDLAQDGIDVEALIKVLRSRKDLLKMKSRTLRRASLTKEGRAAAKKGVDAAEEVSALTSEMLATGRWREVTFRRFDVTLPAEVPRPGKAHPLTQIILETREAFLSMGFTEVYTDFIESGFWDFDALFQPQDHPAREMQDTFYLSRPESLALPDDEELIERVRRTHEDGWETGSAGWGYEWSRDKAKQAILRTHTTATTARALAEDPNPPRKVFTVGNVFRRETVSFKHLAEFLQIDGIVVDEKATLATLKGTLAEYYRQLGFPKIKFKPSFFPYTEPSAEVFVWFEARQQWVEMGGSGVFRPEVTEPLGCKVPVLAWGLGLERLAMMRYGVDAIKALYDPDLGWLKEVPLCR
ncbi:MAG: phenylalanine--tRNA ligase subunit alpha [Planctomycetota bacterium]|jgi:phenylalanyl-tRNA synthetase alpha chain